MGEVVRTAVCESCNTLLEDVRTPNSRHASWRHGDGRTDHPPVPALGTTQTAR